MLKTLIKIRLTSFFSGMFRSSKNGKNKPGVAVLLGLLLLYGFGMFGFMFYQLFSTLNVITTTQYSWLYFGLAGLLATLISFFSTVFLTTQQLFESKDNELLLSMPIKPSDILISRMFSIYIMNFIMSALVILPAEAARVINGSQEILPVIAILIIVPLLALTLSCVFGWIIAAIASKIRNKNTATTILSLLFLAVYLFVFSQGNTVVTRLIDNPEAFASGIKGYMYPFYLLGDGVNGGNLASFEIFAAICIVPFIIASYVISKSFIKISTAKKGISKIKYKEKELKTSSVGAALLNKEIKHFLGSSIYLMNAGLGILFSLIAAVALLIKGPSAIQILFSTPDQPFSISVLSCIACFMICLLCGMSEITAPSISIEGKNIWLCRSLPIDTKEILKAKIRLHLVFTMPATIFCSFSAAIVLKQVSIDTLFLFAVPIMFNLFCAYFGLAINLWFPKLDWINETQAVKQGVAPMIAMLGSMVISFVPCLLLVVTNNTLPMWILLMISFAFYTALYLVFRGIVYSNGVKRFEKFA